LKSLVTLNFQVQILFNLVIAAIQAVPRALCSMS
jgi:hypothetical protein